MDLEARVRRQSRRVIISEILMVIAVGVLVLILGFVVSGYWVGSDLKVERQGLLQISSMPTGASVEVDGASSWLQRTNTSKVLAVGEHTIKLSKDGYDTWERTVKIQEGLLYRVHYPRLFLLERKEESAYEFSTKTDTGCENQDSECINVSLLTVSPDQNTMLIATHNYEWRVLKLNGEKVEEQKMDVATAGMPQLYIGEIVSAEWASDNEHILIQVKTETGIEWIVFDIRAPENSVNLTTVFGVKFDKIKMMDGALNNLLAVVNGDLQKIDVAAKKLSTVIAPQVTDFAYAGNGRVVYSARRAETAVEANDLLNSSNTTREYYVGLKKIGDEDMNIVTHTVTPAKVAVVEFYDDKYFAILAENNIRLVGQDDYVEILSKDLSFLPETIKVGLDGEYINMSKGEQIATLDMEVMEVREWKTEGEFGWLDGDMIYAVKDGEVIAYDFDGLNRRALANGAKPGEPVFITDNKWLYYMGESGLMRMRIME